jgi:hypothetical protein
MNRGEVIGNKHKTKYQHPGKISYICYVIGLGFFFLITTMFRLRGLTVSCLGSLKMMIEVSNTVEITDAKL